MSADEAFLAAIRANPADDTVRLVYADWLDERGDPRADFLRLDCHLHRLPAGSVEYQNQHQRLNELCQSLDRRWLTAVCRVPVDLGRTTLTAAAWDVSGADWTVSAGGVSDIGGYRSRNEDLIVLDPVHPIAIVLDGMGREPAGERAAAVGGEALRRVIADGPIADETAEDFIRRALRTANDAFRGIHADQDFRTAGTTAVLSTIRGGKVYVSWAGDSMAYRVSHGGVEPLTWMHDFRTIICQRNGISEEEANAMRWRNVLVHFLGGDLPDPIEVPSFVPRPGDRLILATDDIHKWFSELPFVAACRLHPGPLACADHLVRAALDGGSRDNATCVVVAFDTPTDTAALTR